MVTRDEYNKAIIKAQVNYRIAGMTPEMWIYYRDALYVAINYESQFPRPFRIPTVLLIPQAI